MKLFGKILAALIAGVLSVVAVQQVFRRLYAGFGNNYFNLPQNGGETEE